MVVLLLLGHSLLDMMLHLSDLCKVPTKGRVTPYRVLFCELKVNDSTRPLYGQVTIKLVHKRGTHHEYARGTLAQRRGARHSP